MARKKGGKSKGFISQGQRPNVSRDTRNIMRREYLANDLSVSLNKQKAWAAGKNVMITIPNPIKSETNKPFVRVPVTQLWGKPGAKYRMKDSGITEVK